MRVICSIPGAVPGLINGHPFARDEAGLLVSVGEVSPENLELFSSVPGYSVERGDGLPPSSRSLVDDEVQRLQFALVEAQRQVAHAQDEAVDLRSRLADADVVVADLRAKLAAAEAKLAAAQPAPTDQPAVDQPAGAAAGAAAKGSKGGKAASA